MLQISRKYGLEICLCSTVIYKWGSPDRIKIILRSFFRKIILKEQSHCSIGPTLYLHTISVMVRWKFAYLLTLTKDTSSVNPMWYSHNNRAVNVRELQQLWAWAVCCEQQIGNSLRAHYGKAEIEVILKSDIERLIVMIIAKEMMMHRNGCCRYWIAQYAIVKASSHATFLGDPLIEL